MKADVREAVVGAFVLIVLVGVLVTAYRSERLVETGGWTLEAVFGRVDGLAPGADVRMAGVKVGEVRSLRLIDGFRAVVELNLVDGVPVPADTAAAIHTDGLFGGKFVILDPGGDPSLLEAGDAITFTQDALRVDELLEQIIAMGRSRHADGDRDAR